MTPWWPPRRSRTWSRKTSAAGCDAWSPTDILGSTRALLVGFWLALLALAIAGVIGVALWRAE